MYTKERLKLNIKNFREGICIQVFNVRFNNQVSVTTTNGLVTIWP